MRPRQEQRCADESTSSARSPSTAAWLGDEPEFTVAVAMTTSGAPVVCAAGVLDRSAVDELRNTLLAYLHHCAHGSAIICDLSRARILDPAPVTRLLTDAAARATLRSGYLLVRPGSGLLPATAASLAVWGGVLLEDMDDGLRRTRAPAFEHDERHVRRILHRTIRHALRELRSLPSGATLDPATCQALRWRLADAAHAGVGADVHLLAPAAGVRMALTCLDAGQYRDAYFTLLTAEDHLVGRAEPPSPPAPTSLPAPRTGEVPDTADGIGRAPARPASGVVRSSGAAAPSRATSREH